MTTRRIVTLAGTGAAGFSGDGGPATSAALHYPWMIAFQPSGDVIFTENNGQRVRRISITSGLIATLVGTGDAGFNGDGNAGTSTNLNSPLGLVVDASGRVYFSDRNNQRIRFFDHTQHSPTPSPTASTTPYCQPSLFRPFPRMDLVGALVGTALSPGAATLVASEAHCRQACCDAAACDGYAFDAATSTIHAVSHCYLYVNVTQLVPSSGYASGLYESTLL